MYLRYLIIFIKNNLILIQTDFDSFHRPLVAADPRPLPLPIKNRNKHDYISNLLSINLKNILKAYIIINCCCMSEWAGLGTSKNETVPKV